MKTADLTGPALRYAVALAEGAVWVPQEPARWGYLRWPTDPPTYSSRAPDYLTGPAGDDIIDREKISITVSTYPEGWWACLGTARMDAVGQFGATRREAAMRAWVVHKLGPEIDIPKELL